jgi:hypothetical protein
MGVPGAAGSRGPRKPTTTDVTTRRPFARRVLALSLSALGLFGCHAAAQTTEPVVAVRADTLDDAEAPGEGTGGMTRVYGTVVRDSAAGDVAPVRLSRADSIAMVRVRRAADRDRGMRVTVSLLERRVRVLEGADTLLDVPAAIGSGERLEHEGRVWTFETPRGRRRVLGREADPIWIPPDWHYVELARDSGFALARLPTNRSVKLSDGRRLVARGERVGILDEKGRFEALPPDEEIVFDSTLYIPPLGTVNRRIRGELGPYRLDLGGGYLLHGTPYTESIGDAATHGCVRLADEDIAWLFMNVPEGTPVYIY